jgi:hypothetical protein
MSESKVESSRFVITIEVGEVWFFVPRERAIVGERGIFVRNLELPVGTPVVIQVCKKQEAVSVPGVVSANDRDFGLAIEFKDEMGQAAR